MLTANSPFTRQIAVARCTPMAMRSSQRNETVLVFHSVCWHRREDLSDEPLHWHDDLPPKL